MLDKRLPFLVSASFSHFKSPYGWRFDLIVRDKRLECGVYDALTELEQEGYSVSLRTVQRDLDKLAEWANLDFEEDLQGQRRWFRDHRHSEVLDAMPTSEAFLLVLSEKLLRKAVPNNRSSKLESWLRKADAKLSSSHQLSNWKSKVCVVPDSLPLIYTDKHIEEQYRQEIYECVLKEEQLKITYTSLRTTEFKDYYLNPLGLIIRDQTHYLVATKQESPEQPQLFVFHRILFAQREYSPIIPPKSFCLAEYFAKNPTGWILDHTPQQVVLRVRDFAADVLQRNKLAADQELKPLDGDWIEVRFTSYPTYDLVSWILKFGHDVVCEAPTELKDMVLERLEASLANYQ